MAIMCGNCKQYRPNVAAVRGCHLAAGIITASVVESECDKWIRMDKEYGTPKDSPLHHDNRCKASHLSPVQIVDYPDPFSFPNEEPVDDSATRKSSQHSISAQEIRVYLNVPFKEKEKAKKDFNARWDATKRSWYVDSGTFDIYERDIPSHWKLTASDSLEPITEDGVYRFFGDTFRAQWNRENTRMYGKRLIIEDGAIEWKYEPGILARIAGARKLTLEEAKEYGKLYGECIRCGARLTDETSIAEGIGPICKEKF